MNADEQLDQITARIQTSRDTEFGDVCHWIAYTAHTNGEYHADAAADWNLTNRNAIGLAIRHLERNGIIRSTGEHRRSSIAAGRGRRSYVYELTPLGQHALAVWPQPSTKRRQELTAAAWPAPAAATHQLTMPIGGRS